MVRTTRCARLCLPSSPRISPPQLHALLRPPWRGIHENLQSLDAAEASHLPAKGWVSYLEAVAGSIQAVSLPDVHRVDLEILVGDWQRFPCMREIEVSDAQSLSGSCAKFNERFPPRPPPPPPPPLPGDLRRVRDYCSKRGLSCRPIASSSDELRALNTLMDAFLADPAAFGSHDESFLREWCSMRCERERTAVYGDAAPGIRVLRLTNARKAKNTTLRPLLIHAGATLECLRVTGAKMVDSRILEGIFGKGFYKDAQSARWAEYWNGDSQNAHGQDRDGNGPPKISLLELGACNRGYVPSAELRELTFAQCGRVYENDIGELLEQGQRLEWLDLSWSPSVGNTSRVDGWWGLPKHLPCMTTLILDQCQGLSDASLYNFVSLAPALEHLSLRGCGQVSNAGLNCLIAPVGSTISCLGNGHGKSVRSSSSVSSSPSYIVPAPAPASAPSYRPSASKMRSLDLRHTRVTGAFVARAEVLLPRLNTLILDGCRGVPRDVRKRIRESPRFCNCERGASMFAFPPEGTGSVLHGAVREMINKRVRERVSGSHVVSPSSAGVPTDSRWHNSKARSKSGSSASSSSSSSASSSSSSFSSLTPVATWSSGATAAASTRIGPSEIDAMVDWDAGESDTSSSSFCESESDDGEDWGEGQEH